MNDDLIRSLQQRNAGVRLRQSAEHRAMALAQEVMALRSALSELQVRLDDALASYATLEAENEFIVKRVQERSARECVSFMILDPDANQQEACAAAVRALSPEELKGKK